MYVRTVPRARGAIAAVGPPRRPGAPPLAEHGVEEGECEDRGLELQLARAGGLEVGVVQRVVDAQHRGLDTGGRFRDENHALLEQADRQQARGRGRENERELRVGTERWNIARRRDASTQSRQPVRRRELQILQQHPAAGRRRRNDRRFSGRLRRRRAERHHRQPARAVHVGRF